MEAQVQFERFGNILDLERSLVLLREAVSSTPLDSADRPEFLNDLGRTYRLRFERFGEVQDIDLAIQQQCEAVTSTPLDSADRPIYLTNMGKYHSRFEQFGGGAGH